MRRHQRSRSCGRRSPSCWIDTEALKYLGARAITKLLRGELPGPEASAGKMGWVETHQRLQELAMEIEGPYAQLVAGSDRAVDGGVWQYAFLRSRANSIEGGTTEIQKNIIGERVLGLAEGLEDTAMDFGFNQEQELLRATARKFLENECTSELRPRAHGGAGRRDRRVLDQAGRAGMARASSIRRSTAAPASASWT